MSWDGGMGKWSRKRREWSTECQLMDALIKCRKHTILIDSDWLDHMYEIKLDIKRDVSLRRHVIRYLLTLKTNANNSSRNSR